MEEATSRVNNEPLYYVQLPPSEDLSKALKNPQCFIGNYQGFFEDALKEDAIMLQLRLLDSPKRAAVESILKKGRRNGNNDAD